MSCGPWKPIELEIFHSRISEIHFPVTLSDDLSLARVDFQIDIEAPPPRPSLQVTLYLPSIARTEEKELVYSETLPVETSSVTGTITLHSPHLWCPHGYGPQPLYLLIVSLYSHAGLLSTKIQHIAFRKVKLVETPLDEGTSFYFEVNNVPIFCAGANWIPADNLLTRITPSRYREWLSLLISGNQNMLRFWGGGIYESDVLYDIADELGILIWQDFLFACGQYPAHPSFRESVATEAITQVKRLRHHPCIVLFAGNNEDYQIAESEKLDYDPTDTNPENWLKTNFPARYFYEKLFPEIVAEYAPGIAYHPGSPWGGKRTSDPAVGDIHQWNGNDPI
jgi:beta-mannosidase